MGPKPAGIMLEGLLALPGEILSLKDSPLNASACVSVFKFDWQADRNSVKKSNENACLITYTPKNNLKN